jgi:hypothetical protein
MAQENYIRRKGTTPNTSTIISSKVKIYAGASSTEQVGLIANFDPSESRSAEPVRGIGFGDQIAELVPGMTDPISISVGRTAQYLSNLYKAFGYNGGVDGIVRSLKHHRWPFDVKQEIVLSWLVSGSAGAGTIDSSDAHDGGVSGTDGTTSFESTTPGLDASIETATGVSTAQTLKAIKTVYEGCWFTDWSTSYTSDTTIVQESGTIQCTDVYDDVANAGWQYDARSSDSQYNGSNSDSNSGGRTYRNNLA